MPRDLRPNLNFLWTAVAVWCTGRIFSSDDNAGGKVTWQKQPYEPYESGAGRLDTSRDGCRSSLSLPRLSRTSTLGASGSLLIRVYTAYNQKPRRKFEP